MAIEVKYARCNYETEVVVTRIVVGDGVSKPEAMIHFGIVSTTPLKRWYRLYREGGAWTFKPKPKGRPKGPIWTVPPTHKEELQKRMRKLEV